MSSSARVMHGWYLTSLLCLSVRSLVSARGDVLSTCWTSGAWRVDRCHWPAFTLTTHTWPGQHYQVTTTYRWWSSLRGDVTIPVDDDRRCLQTTTNAWWTSVSDDDDEQMMDGHRWQITITNRWLPSLSDVKTFCKLFVFVLCMFNMVTSLN